VITVFDHVDFDHLQTLLRLIVEEVHSTGWHVNSAYPPTTPQPPTVVPGDQWLRTDAAETDLAAASKVVDRARTTLLGRTKPGRCARVVRRRGRTAARARYRFDTSPRTLR
jgi:hypothetical protein